jgi:hypothetical protein
MGYRVVILAAGDGTRWKNYRETPKHLVEIEGQRLLDRTISQYKKYTDDIVVVGSDERYRIDGTQLFVPDRPMKFVYPNYVPREWREMDKFLSSVHLWDTSKRTILVYGDVYFTDEAVHTIMTHEGSWRCFCRTKESQITGKMCKEIFSFSLDPEHHNVFQRALDVLASTNTTTGGWSLFRYLTSGNANVNKNYEQVFNNDKYVEIDDWTEDFDFPNDLIEWEKRRNVN